MFTEEEIRKVRIKGGEKLEVDGLERELYIVKMAGAATLEAADIQEGVKAGKKKQREFFEYLLANAIADKDGNLIGASNAKELVQFIPAGDMIRIAGVVNKATSTAAEKASPGNS